MIPAAGWIRLQGKDGPIFRMIGVGPLSYVTPAQFASLPETLRNAPTDRPSWSRWWQRNYREIFARIRGGADAEPVVLDLIQGGTPIVEAIQYARSIAPATAPAAFPRIVQALQAAGRVAEAAWVAGNTPASGNASRRPAATTASAVAPEIIAGGLLLLALL